MPIVWRWVVMNNFKEYVALKVGGRMSRERDYLSSTSGEEGLDRDLAVGSLWDGAC